MLDLVSASLEKMKQAKDKVVKDISEVSKSEWAYYIGYGITFFIPTAAVASVLGKAGKVGKMLGKLLVWIEKVLGELFEIGLKRGGAVVDNLLAFFQGVVSKFKKGTQEVRGVIKSLFIKLKEWLENFVGKIGEVGIKVIDNTLMTVERITQKVNDKLTEFYLITYKKTNGQLLFSIIPIEPFISIARDLITWNVRKNLKALADEGFELLEKDGTYLLKYGEEIREIGNFREATKELNRLLDKSTLKEAKKTLDDALAWRKKLDEFEILRKENPESYLKELKYEELLRQPPKKPCFLAGTPILTPSGIIAIENIKAGDQVYCYDTVLNIYTTQAVSQTFTNATDKYLEIKISNAEILQVTGQHLFYQKTTNTWLKANQLQQGMQLYLPLTNTFITIESIQVVEEHAATYNFEVPLFNNYLVGNTGILTHNASKYKTVDDLTTRKYAFYELFTLKNRVAETQYIGKTTRDDLDIRNSEHKNQGKKKGSQSKHYWKFSEKPQIVNLNQGALEMVEMTEIQSSIWEKYYLEEHKYKTGNKLRNTQNPISKKRFDALKKSGKHANICSFF